MSKHLCQYNSKAALGQVQSGTAKVDQQSNSWIWTFLTALEWNRYLISVQLLREKSDECAKQNLLLCRREFGIMCLEVGALQTQTLYVQIVCCRNFYFKTLLLIIVIYLIFWSGSLVLMPSVYVLCVGDEDLQVSYFGSTRGHREHWLYIFSSMKTKLKLSNAAFTIGFLNISG